MKSHAPPGAFCCLCGVLLGYKKLVGVNVGVEVRFYKPKTRISYVDTRVFAGGVREI